MLSDLSLGRSEGLIRITTSCTNTCYVETEDSQERYSMAKKVMIPLEMVESIAWSEQLGSKLKEIREKDKKLSRNKLVNLIRDAGTSISPQHIQKLETGFKAKSGENQIAKSVGTKTIKAILFALDYPLNKFLSVKENYTDLKP